MIMEPRRSLKKTRSYGGVQKGPRNSLTSPTLTPGRPPYKERVRLAPLGVPQAIEQNQRQRRSQQSTTGRLRRGSQTSDSSPGTVSPPSSPTRKPHAAPLLRESDSERLHGFRADIDEKAGGSGEVQEVAIAVLGAPAVGKSTFVHCVLDLKNASTSPVASGRVSLEGRISVVRLLELGLEDIQVTIAQSVRWPERVGDQKMPDVDGVLALYDVMDPSSIIRMPSLLSESFRYSMALPFQRDTRNSVAFISKDLSRRTT